MKSQLQLRRGGYEEDDQDAAQEQTGENERANERERESETTRQRECRMCHRQRLPVESRGREETISLIEHAFDTRKFDASNASIVHDEWTLDAKVCETCARFNYHFTSNG